MEMRRRFTALFIGIMMMASMFAFTTGAAAEKAETPDNYVEVTEQDMLLVEKLEAFGVIANEYDATTYVTRRQMTEIIAKFIGVSQHRSTASETPFRDVSINDESIFAINTLYDLGIITGDNDLRFYPDNYITCDEATVFVVNSIGYKIFAEREGGYPTGYHRIAIKLGMYDKLNINIGTSKMRVIDIYKMLDSALSASAVIPIYIGENNTQYTFSDTETFLSKTYGIKKYKGKVTGNEYTKLTNDDSKLTDEQIEIDGKIYDTPGYFYGYFLGYNVDYYIKEDAGERELVYVEETPKINSTLRIDAEDIIKSKTTSDRIYYYEDEDIQHIEFARIFDAIYNKQCVTNYGTLVNLIPDNGYIEVLDNNKDGVYDIIFVYEYKNVVVEAVDSYNEAITDKLTGNKVSLDSYKYKVKYIKLDDNTDASFDEIAQGDVLSIAESKGTNKAITVYISKTPIVGTITEYDNTLGYNIDGTYYEEAEEYSGDTLAVGLSGAFYIDVNNKIVLHEYDSSSDYSSIGVMMGIDYKITTLDANIEVRIFTTDEEIINVTLADVVKVDGRRCKLEKDSDRDFVLSSISKGKISGGLYYVENTYAIKYKLSSDGLLKELDTGAIGGTGNINIEVDNGEYMLSRYHNMLTCYTPKEGGGYSSKFIRYNGKDALIFHTPSAGHLNETDDYGLVDELRYNRYYAKSSYRSDNYTDFIENYSLYSFHTTDIGIVDIIILRDYGAAGGLTSSSPLGVITAITKGSDKWGSVTDRIYMGEGVMGDLAERIDFKKNGTTTEVLSKDLIEATAPALPELRAGVVIRFGKNYEGKIDTIHVVAEYDLETNTITPTFKDSSTFIEDADIPNKVGNLAVCEVLINDTKTKMIECTTNGTDILPFVTENATVKIYRSEREKIEDGTIADIASHDKVVVRLGEYFEIREIIVFR